MLLSVMCWQDAATRSGLFENEGVLLDIDVMADYCNVLDKDRSGGV